MRMARFIVFSALFIFLSGFVSIQSDDYRELLSNSESIMAQGDFYEALIALKSLLTADERSEMQEQAFWLANSLCETLVRDNILSTEFENAYKNEHDNKSPFDEDFMQYEKIVVLNQLGADIRFNHLGYCYDYHYGFLRQLVQIYPDSKLCHASEYYLIERAFNERRPVERWLNDLYLYVEKYNNSGIGELYMAYLDIAHICDNLWQFLTYPDGTYSEPFMSKDPSFNKERASKYKAEALKYYAKVIISGYSPRFGYYGRGDIMERYEEIKQDKKTNSAWIIYD